MPPVPGRGESPVGVRLDFTPETADACPLIVGRFFGGVRNGPSPDWLRNRLRAVGLRPISALVDITNLVSLERARPLHVFDADKLAGNIHVRLARPGETLDALDDKSCALDPEMTVIADDNGPVALAGVIGGAATGCTAETTNVFLESAWFDPVRTAATGRKLRIDSDARYRFERGVDRAGTVPGAERATRLILDLCGGEASALAIAGAAPRDDRRIAFRPARVHALGGLDVPPERAAEILGSLGFAPEKARGDKGAMTCRVPSWRHDIAGEADLVEEVLRVVGFESIPAVSLPRPRAVARPALESAGRRERRARRALAARGLDECVTWSFLGAAEAQRFGGGGAALRLANPIGSTLTDMRPNLLPNLLAAAARNRARGADDFGLFEVGPVYAGDSPGDQAAVAGGVRCGASGPRHWLAAPRPVDAFDAKGDALALVAALGGPADRLQAAPDAPDWYHPGQSGVLRLGPRNTVAHFGMVHPRAAESFDLPGPACAFEVFLDRLPPAGRPRRTPPDLSGLQPVRRDLAFVIDKAFPAGDLLRLVRGLSGKVPGKYALSDVALFDDYRGEGVGEGRKSLAVAFAIRPGARTPTDEEIQAVVDAIVARVEKATGGTLRR